MTVRITGRIELETPITLADMEQFVAQAKDMGVSTTKQLFVSTTSGYSYARISTQA